MLTALYIGDIESIGCRLRPILTTHIGLHAHGDYGVTPQRREIGSFHAFCGPLPREPLHCKILCTRMKVTACCVSVCPAAMLATKQNVLLVEL